MTADLEKSTLQDRFQHLLSLIKSERFLKKQGLGNEVPFFICPYQPTEAVEINKMIKQLINKLEQSGVQVLDINLYDLSVELLKQGGDWEWYLKNEQTMSKAELKDQLQSILDSAENLIPAIAEKMQENSFDVLFISGVGEVFPYIRSHNILNNLQSTAKEKPTVMFFPGAYTHSLQDGSSLDLFSRLHDDKYYRAFNIFHCEY
jgi:bacteriophage exclusion system BrxB-like protein